MGEKELAINCLTTQKYPEKLINFRASLSIRD